MIIIDGRESAIHISNFANLEQVLVKVMEEEIKENHVVTDVLINDEAFSELYPHQAEDIESNEISRLEVRTVPMETMATDVTQELHKVIGFLQTGGARVALLFRQGELADALELLQDLLDVTRHFLGTISILADSFPQENTSLFKSQSSELDSLLSEMGDVLSNQDWVLLADLLEFEFLPNLKAWSGVLSSINSDIAASGK